MFLVKTKRTGDHELISKVVSVEFEDAGMRLVFAGENKTKPSYSVLVERAELPKMLADIQATGTKAVSVDHLLNRIDELRAENSRLTEMFAKERARNINIVDYVRDIANTANRAAKEIDCYRVGWRQIR